MRVFENETSRDKNLECSGSTEHPDSAVKVPHEPFEVSARSCSRTSVEASEKSKYPAIALK